MLIGALVWLELHADQPMIDFRILRNRLFGVSNLASLFAAGGFLGLLFVAPIWLQTGRGLSAFASGSSTAPEAIGVLVSSQLVGRLYPRIGPRRLVSGGLVGVTIATMTLALVMNGNLWVFRAVMFAIGVGWAYVVIPMNAGVFAQVSTRDMGRAAALYNAQRQLAAALGVATLATIVGTQTAGSGLAGNTTVFRIAFLSAAGFTLAGAAIALAIRDRDAASTMRRTTTSSPAAPAACTAAGSATRSVRAGARFAGRVGGLEAVTAATGPDGIGVVDGEPTAHQLIDVVDLGALEILRGVRVDVHLEAPAHVHHLVILTRRVLVEPHPVGEARAPARLDEDPQSELTVGRLVGDQTHELLTGGVGDRDDRRRGDCHGADIIRHAPVRETSPPLRDASATGARRAGRSPSRPRASGSPACMRFATAPSRMNSARK